MAKFRVIARPVSPDDPDAKAFAAGVITKPPGRSLRDLLRYTGGVYEEKLVFSPRFREEIRRVAELTDDSYLLALAERGEVPVPFGHLRDLDPETPITIACELQYDQSERERLGLTHSGPFDPKKGVFMDNPLGKE